MSENPIRTLIFDYGNTLVKSASLIDSAIETMGQTVGYRIGRDIESQIRALYTPDQVTQPDWQTVWKNAFHYNGVTYSEETALAHLTAFNRQGCLYPETLNLLKQLKAAGYRLGLLSNVTGPAALFDQDLQDKGICDCFDVIARSSKTGIRKSAPHAFQNLLFDLNCTADEALMIGDSELADIRGAYKAGLQTLRVSASIPCETQADFQSTPEELNSTLQSILNRQGVPYV